MTELDRETYRLLELARVARKPSATDRARVKRRLGALLGAGAVGQLAAAGQAEASAGASASSSASGSASSSAGASVSASAGAGAAKTLLTSAAGSWTMAGVAALGAIIGGYVAVVTHLPTSAAPSAQIAPPPMIAAPAPTPLPAIAPAPSSPPAEATPPTRRAPRARARGATDSLTQELALLHQARAAWQRGDAGSALTLLDRHRVRYPRSEVGVERDALRVLSLCELGQVEDATRVAGRLLKRAPASPLRAAVERSCAAE
jgi:hypothetical protein